MYRIESAELKDVDIILDCKLDIIFNSDEITQIEKSDMEKVVNCCEEEIRENIKDYKMVYEQEDLVAIYATSDYNDGILIDTLYVMPDSRKSGVASNLINGIISQNFKPLYVWIYKNNDVALHLYKKYNFNIEEETEYRYFMKNVNEKESNNSIKLKMFQDEVMLLAKKYNVNYELIVK
ncbi:MAG: GNAT family N-acetyltransferase [Clostridia bacterium]|nr:GNAT family N-acetyltransferase [Clostridia bacterium]